MLKTVEELGDDLCTYCPLEDWQKGVRFGVMCEGRRCDDAYDAYLERWAEDNGYIKDTEPSA